MGVLRGLFRGLCGTCLIASSQFSIAEELQGSTRFSPKVFVRYGGGLISNVGNSQGSVFIYGGVNLGLVYFFTQDIALGSAYKIESTFGAVPLKGIDLFGRYYLWGLGSVVRTKDSDGNRLVRRSPWASYVGLEYSQRSFNFEFDPEAQTFADRTISGNVSLTNVIWGLDYRLNGHWEANVELSYTLMPFGGSDARVRIKWMLASFGASYVF